MTRWVTAAALSVVGGLHLSWATGSHFPARDELALARRVTGADVMPPRAASAVVGVGLGLVGVLATRPTAYAPTLTTHTRRAAGMALLARALAPTGLLLKGLRLPKPAPEFVRFNGIAYRPLCLALAAGLLRKR